jgi:hypothetical protein
MGVRVSGQLPLEATEPRVLVENYLERVCLEVYYTV